MLENDLDIDMSEFEWWAQSWTWSDSWLEFDFSDIEPEETTEEVKEEAPEVKPEEATEETTEETPEVKTEEEPATEDVDWTLSEIDKLLSELDDNSEKSEETIVKADEVVAKLWDEGEAWEAWALLEQLKVENTQYKNTVDQLNKLITKLNKEKWDVMMRNTELELYGNIDEPNLVYLNWNIEKARWGDNKSKKRIITILDDIRTELAWKTQEDEDMDAKTDLISKVSSFNSSSTPNTKTVWWVDDYEVNL